MREEVKEKKITIEKKKEKSIKEANKSSIQ